VKKFFVGLVLLSSTVFAETMTCNVVIYEASSLGVNIAKEIKASTELIDGDFQFDKCFTTTYKNLKLETCASANDIIGGYSAAVFFSEEGSSVNPQFSHSALVTLKTNKLTSVKGSSPVPYNMLSKFNEAKVNIPDELDPADSAPLDQAVEEGIKKGIIAEGEIAAIMIDECQLTK
jgi:hypothetical protein